ncbi:MAG: TatD family hydrolase [Saccharospirillum sp.]
MIGFDSHCHLDFLDDAPQCMADAETAGIARWLIPGTGPDQWRQAHQRFGQDDRVLLAAGHHPWFLPDSAPDIQSLESWLDQHSDSVAIGEIGLDFFRHHPRSAVAEHQFDWFMAQLAVSSECLQPVIIHSVKAHDRILQGLKRYPRVGGVVHGFVGPYAQAKAYLDRGFYLGAGSVVFQSAKTLDAFARIPAERILVETDAPDQRVPDQYRNAADPSDTGLPDNALLDWLSILKRIAAARQMDSAILTEQVCQNASSLFRL